MDEKARASLLMAGVPRTAKVIEIGPSLRPLAPKRDGWNVTIVDHATRAGLIAKYHGDPVVDPDVIEEVDLVWQGGDLTDLVGEASWGTYDAFIASHVIEHTTDLVAFLRSARVLLKDEGVVILALPDKRKCFDVFRPVSTTGDVLEAFLQKRDRHTIRTHFDFCMYHAKRNNNPGWHLGEQGAAVMPYRIKDGLVVATFADRAEYVDAHAWTFTPSSFELMILELRAMGVLSLSIEKTEQAYYTEFFAWLRPCEEIEDDETIHDYRRRLLERIATEQADITRQIAGSPLTSFENLKTALRGFLSES